MIKDRILASIEVKQLLLNDQEIQQTISQIIEIITLAYRNGNKVLFCGNGGSAADAQHLAAELSGKFYIDRDPLEAEACHVNTSFLTAVGNDYGYNKAYARYVNSTGKKGDVLIGLSTSGNSENIIEAFIAGQKIGTINVAFTGKTGGKMKDYCNYLLNVPSLDTPRIQEVHILLGHIICEFVERNLFSNEK